MISFTRRTIKLGDKIVDIKEFGVYFRTGFGLHTTIIEAIQCCQSRDLDPEMNIKAVPVAIGVDGSYEELV